jgi:hypothetical protein
MTALDDQAELIAQRVAELLSGLKQPILTLQEAVRYTKHGSDTSFYRWAAKWSVKAVSRGRFSRRWLDRGLEREAHSGRRLPLNRKSPS